MRQTSVVVLAAAVIAGASAVSVSAQQQRSLGDLFGSQKSKVQKEKKKAEKAEKERQRLFGQPVAPTVVQPTVVCGMTLMPADPQHDPGIRRTPPTNGQTFTMKPIVPKDCQIAK
jgi:hypothetical protein